MVFGGCNCGSPEPGKLSNTSIAESASSRLGITTYGSTGQINFTDGISTNVLHSQGTFIKFEQKVSGVALKDIQIGKNLKITIPVPTFKTVRTDVGKTLDIGKLFNQ